MNQPPDNPRDIPGGPILTSLFACVIITLCWGVGIAPIDAPHIAVPVIVGAYVFTVGIGSGYVYARLSRPQASDEAEYTITNPRGENYD